MSESSDGSIEIIGFHYRLSWGDCCSRREEQAGEDLIRVLRLSAVQDFLKKIFSTAFGSPPRSGIPILR